MEEPLPSWGPTFEDSNTAFLWFVSLRPFGPTKLLSSEILDRDPAHHERFQNGTEKVWKQTKS